MAVKIVGMDAVQAKLKAMQERAMRGRWFMDLAALSMHKDVMEHFEQERGPSGRWRARTEPYKSRIEAKGKTKILQVEGRLKGSVTFKTTDKTATVYTGVDYAPTHQYGDPARHIPARQFMWLSAERMRNIRDRFATWFLSGNAT